MSLRSRIVLCGRSDLNPQRYFSGSLSNLMLFDEPLDSSAIEALYLSYLRQAVQHPIGVMPANERCV